MPIDATIPLQVKQPEFQDPTNALMRVLQIQGLQDARQKEQRALDQQDALNSAYGGALGPDGKIDENKLYSLLSGKGQGSQIPGVQKSLADVAKTRSETSKNDASAFSSNTEGENKTIAVYRDASQSITDPQSAIAFVTHMHSDPRLANSAIARIPLEQALSQIPQDPNQLGAWKQQFALGATKFMELNKPTTNVVNTGGTTQMVQTPGLGGAPTVAQTFTNTVSPDAKLSSDTSIKTTGMNNATSVKTTGMNNATSTANTNANIGKDYRVAGLNPDGTDPSGAVGGLTQQAIDNAAKRYNFDGTLPPSLGRGSQGPRDIRAIQNRAAELNGAAPDDASGGRASQMANKADVGALNKVTSQQQLASTFERTANANAELALGLSKKMDRTGIPLINAGIQAWRTGTGSPEATQFAAANETFVNEYAKIMSGGMGNGATSDSARAKAHSLLSTAMTPEQYEGNVRLLQNEMQNRMKGYSDQAAEIKTRMQGGTHPAAPSAGAPAASGGGIPAGWNVRVH